MFSNKYVTRLSMVLALAFVATACEDDETPFVDTGSDAAETDTTMGDAAMDDTSMDDVSMDDTSMATTDLCLGETDFPLVTAEDLDPDTDGNQTVNSEATDCGRDCLSAEDSRQCSVDCTVAATGVTEPCAGCYGDIVQCTIENCIADCAVDPGSDGCTECQAEFCLDDFYLCTGLEGDAAE